MTAAQRTEHGEPPASGVACLSLAAACLTLTILTAVAIRFGTHAGPQCPTFVAVAATTWALADLATAFLLFAQVFGTGSPYLAILGAGYVFCGLLSLPHMIMFPGLFWPAATLSNGQLQISVELYLTWHAAFPLFIIAAVALEGRLAGAGARIACNGTATGLIVGAAVALPVALGGFTLADSAALPVLVSHGHFLYTLIVCPVVIGVTVAAGWAVTLRRKRLTNLDACLLVALTTSGLDILLNMSGGRYTFAWYLGKFETIVTATAVLALMTADLIAMYRRFADLATIDALTGLRNRRAFDERLRLVLALARRRPASLALLMIDVDRFKNVNDSFGHAAGDAVLTLVSTALRSVAARPLDIVARWGGEEFAILLPDASYPGARALAEKARSAVEQVAYVHTDGSVVRISISVGVAYVEAGVGVADHELVALADRAMYGAKESGRNRVVVEDFAPARPVATATAG